MGKLKNQETDNYFRKVKKEIQDVPEDNEKPTQSARRPPPKACPGLRMTNPYAAPMKQIKSTPISPPFYAGAASDQKVWQRGKLAHKKEFQDVKEEELFLEIRFSKK